MKKIIVSFLFISVLLSSVVHAEKMQRFAVKSAHIVYELTGNITGEKEVWFDDYGMKFFEESNETTTMKIMGITSTQNEHTIVIHDGQTIYDIDMITKTGYKGTLPSMENFQGLTDDMSEAEKKQLADEIMESLEGQKLGNETILGKSCEVMQIMGVKSWIYKGITLKTEANIMGMESNETATKFEENIKIPASKFNPPQDVTYEDMPSYGSMMSFDEDEEDDEDFYEENDVYIPTPISFDDFKSGIKGISSLGYFQTTVMEDKGDYIAMYMNNMGSMIMIGCSGYLNDDMDEGFESFTHKGKTMKYGNFSDEGSNVSSLVVLYESNKLMISINSMTAMSKDDLIKIADKLSF